MSNNNYKSEPDFIFAFKKTSYPINKKIDSFSEFKDGWHYGEGQQFNSLVLEAAKDIIIYLYNNLFTDLDAFPGLNGEILIKAYFSKSSLEIFINKNLTSNYVVEDKKGNDLFSSTTLPIGDLKKLILSQRQREWNLSESYPLTTMTEGYKGSIASPLETHPTTKAAAYRSYPQNALNQGYAGISKPNIQNTPILQSSGSSILKFYLLKLS